MEKKVEKNQYIVVCASFEHKKWKPKKKYRQNGAKGRFFAQIYGVLCQKSAFKRLTKISRFYIIVRRVGKNDVYGMKRKVTSNLRTNPRRKIIYADKCRGQDPCD